MKLGPWLSRSLVLSCFWGAFLSVAAVAQLLCNGQAICAELSLATSGALMLELPILLDLNSGIFAASVLTIAGAVLVFSFDYMSGDSFTVRFHLLVLGFVSSMLLLIVSPNLMSILLGWDGLGVTSFLLVIYFQNSKALAAGLLTALTNRVGDVIILISVAALATQGSWEFWHSAPSLLLISILVPAAAMTKSAQVPFSAWLPAAMAAPTPVSSLVHSSTLVTAGVYVLIRALPSVTWCEPLLVLGCLTMTMASLSALQEMDMKKIVALSTLSQLGLMFCSLGIGQPQVAFFHLLTHAFFKALLFMAVGNSIHLSKDYQDLRAISMGPGGFPATLSFALVANLSLCGLPFLSGFFSKDAILEIFMAQSHGVATAILLMGSVVLTVIYSARLTGLVGLRASLHHGPTSAQDNSLGMATAMAVLWPLAVVSGASLAWIFNGSLLNATIPGELKNLASAMIVGAVISSFWAAAPGETPTPSAWGLGSLWALPFCSAGTLVRHSGNASASLRALDLSWLHLTPLIPLRGSNTSPMDFLGVPHQVLWTTATAGAMLALLSLVYLRALNLISLFKLKI